MESKSNGVTAAAASGTGAGAVAAAAGGTTAHPPEWSAKVNELLSGSGGNSIRFLCELEFVELLANPHYLKFLAQSRYFDDSSFVNFLSYLLYWKEPAYIKYISHAHCLYFLELLQRSEFRTKLLADPNYTDSILHSNQYFHWRFYRYNRFREHEAMAEANSLALRGLITEPQNGFFPPPTATATATASATSSAASTPYPSNGVANGSASDTAASSAMIKH